MLLGGFSGSFSSHGAWAVALGAMGQLFLLCSSCPEPWFLLANRGAVLVPTNESCVCTSVALLKIIAVRGALRWSQIFPVWLSRDPPVCSAPASPSQCSPLQWQIKLVCFVSSSWSRGDHHPLPNHLLCSPWGPRELRTWNRRIVLTRKPSPRVWDGTTQEQHLLLRRLGIRTPDGCDGRAGRGCS